MSNLVFQLAIRRGKTNRPLLDQVGLDLKLIIDNRQLSKNANVGEGFSPLTGLMFGINEPGSGKPPQDAYWVPGFMDPGETDGFSALTLDEWLDDLVIPTGQEVLSRRQLIEYIRDQDGGAHSDPDTKMLKSTAYLDLVNSFPFSKLSSTDVEGQITRIWDLLPPITMPMMRQIAHEILSAIYSQSDVRKVLRPPTLVCLFEGTQMVTAIVPRGYTKMLPVNGKTPAEVDA